MEENVIKRQMPYSKEAEQSVIGAMLMDEKAITTVAEILTPEDFYISAYGKLYQAMTELHDAGKPVDNVVLQEKLKSLNVPPEVSSLEFLTEAVAQVQTSANVKHYANIVSEKSTLRKLIRLNQEIENTCYSESEPLESILDETEKKVFQLVQKRSTEDFVPVRKIVRDAIDKIEIASKNKGSVTGIPTGFIDHLR